jgi:hypothetical protein
MLDQSGGRKIMMGDYVGFNLQKCATTHIGRSTLQYRDYIACQHGFIDIAILSEGKNPFYF